MTSATPPVRPSTSGSRLLQVAARFPLATFLILGFSLGYALAFIWGLAYRGVIPGGGLAAALHIAPDELTGGAVVLSLFPAALFATWAASGRVGVRSLFRRAFHWRVNPGWWLTVLLGLPVLTVSLALLMGDQLRSIDVPSFLASQLMLLLVNFIVINLWEEVAWTGLFQTRLEERHNWLIAALLTAIPFAAIHLPLQFFLDATRDGRLARGRLRPLPAARPAGPADAGGVPSRNRRQPSPGRSAAQRLQPHQQRKWHRGHAARGRFSSARDVDRRCPAHRCDGGRYSFPTEPSVWGRTRRALTNRGGQPYG